MTLTPAVMQSNYIARFLTYRIQTNVLVGTIPFLSAMWSAFLEILTVRLMLY